ncbi:MAG: hypothetical protein LLG14_06340 [Nocardiaceae bacterium]|nr:hypothetical protein [Nocardiaceae bacterium]
MSKLVHRAEVAKLAALLAVPADELTYLEPLDTATIIELREQAFDMLLDADREQLGRAARAVSRVPVSFVARIATRRVPPRLAARVAELLATPRAVKLATRVPADYLAYMAPYIDPIRVAHLLAVAPIDTVAQVARILDQRHDFHSMGRVVSHLDDARLRVAFDAVSDDSIVRTIPFVENSTGIDRILNRLNDDRIIKILHFVDEHDRWVEILQLIAATGNTQRARLADILMHLDQTTRTHILQTVATFGAWDIFLALFGVLPPSGREYFAALIAQRPPELLESIVRAAVQDSLWADLSWLVIAMPPQAGRDFLAMCARIADETGSPGLSELVRQLHEVTDPKTSPTT